MPSIAVSNQIYCFQGTSAEEEAGFSPRLTERSSVREQLPQEGQRRADSSAHAGSQVSGTRKVSHIPPV